MKKKNRLFRCFMAIVNMVALSVPVIVLGYNCVANALNLHFASQSVQHHGGTSDVFSNDLSFAVDELTPYDMNKNILDTLDNFNYLAYNSMPSYSLAQTNDVDSVDDLVVGNYYYYDFGSFANLFDSSYRINFTEFINFHGHSCKFNFAFYFTNYTPDSGAYRLYRLDNNAHLSTFYRLYNLPNTFVFRYYSLGDSFSHIECISRCPTELLPVTTTIVDISSLVEWESVFNGVDYHTIIENGTKDNFLINYDFGNIFFNDSLTNINGNIAPYLMFNFCINYFINISLLLFIPEILLILLDFMKSLLYRFLDKSEV